MDLIVKLLPGLSVKLIANLDKCTTPELPVKQPAELIGELIVDLLIELVA